MDGGRSRELEGAGKRSFLCEKQQRAGEVNSARSANFTSMPASPTSTADFQNKIDSFSVRVTHMFNHIVRIRIRTLSQHVRAMG